MKLSAFILSIIILSCTISSTEERKFSNLELNLKLNNLRKQFELSILDSTFSKDSTVYLFANDFLYYELTDQNNKHLVNSSIEYWSKNFNDSICLLKFILYDNDKDRITFECDEFHLAMSSGLIVNLNYSIGFDDFIPEITIDTTVSDSLFNHRQNLLNERTKKYDPRFEICGTSDLNFLFKGAGKANIPITAEKVRAIASQWLNI